MQNNRLVKSKYMFNSLSNVNKNWELPVFFGEQAVVKVYLADVQKQYVTSFNQQFLLHVTNLLSI